MAVLETIKKEAHSLAGLPFLKEAYVFGSVLSERPVRVEILLVSERPISPKEKFEAKKTVRDVFWEVNLPWDIKIAAANDLAAQVSQRRGFGRIFDDATVRVFQKPSF